MQDRRPTTELNLGHIWREEHKQNAFGTADVLGSYTTTGEHCTAFTTVVPTLQGTREPNQSATFQARQIEDKANKTHRYDGRDTGTIRPAGTHLSGSVVFLFACTSVSPVPKEANIYSHQDFVNSRKGKHWHKNIVPVTQRKANLGPGGITWESFLEDRLNISKAVPYKTLVLTTMNIICYKHLEIHMLQVQNWIHKGTRTSSDHSRSAFCTKSLAPRGHPDQLFVGCSPHILLQIHFHSQ